MKFHTAMTAFSMSLLLASIGYAQRTVVGKAADSKKISSVLNAMARVLPLPEYSQVASDFCAKGKVEIKVLVSENGNVISADAISGDELLRESAVAAASKAKFRNPADGPPVRLRGILVYKFEGVKRCIPAGVANDKSLKRSTPFPDHSFALTKPVKVVVRIRVNGVGNVERALASKDIDPAIKAMAEKLALETKFTQLPHGPMDIFVAASLVFIFKPGGKIEY